MDRAAGHLANMLESSPSGDQRAAILVKDSHTLHVTALTDVSTGYGFGKYKNVTDAVRSEPSFLVLFRESNKYEQRRIPVWADI